MRVRSNRQSETRHRGGFARRKSFGRHEPPPAPAVEQSSGRTEDDLADERRLRASGGPNDRAQYACGCGFVWEADVSASVECPRCGASQAW